MGSITASIHDIRRLNDNEDKGHGLRAKDWVFGCGQ